MSVATISAFRPCCSAYERKLDSTRGKREYARSQAHRTGAPMSASRMTLSMKSMLSGSDSPGRSALIATTMPSRVTMTCCDFPSALPPPFLPLDPVIMLVSALVESCRSSHAM